MVTRVWSRVFIAVAKPVPSSPIIRVGGDADVVEVDLAGRRLPLMPSFFSGAPKETPSSDFSTTNAEMPPRVFFSGSVTAMTV